MTIDAPDAATGTEAAENAETLTAEPDATDTAPADASVTAPPARTAPSVRRVVAAIAVVLVVTLAVAGWVTARVRLGEARDDLADTRVSLTARQDALTIAERRHALTEAGLGQVQSDIETAVTDRGWLEGLVANTEAEVATVAAAQAETA
ncbi:MAG: hypothetical protein PV358_16265, partial [Acidimicrobiales bacterium]|nr:hypothetical protein [Acidimicrobiales bacterium]